jgi:hypothetical protein
MKNTKLSAEQILENIDPKIVQNARNAYFALTLLKKFKHENGKIDYVKAYEYFAENFPEDITYKKQNTRCGYNCIALFRGVEMVGIGDFFTERGKQIESRHPETDVWITQSIEKLFKIIASKYFKDLYDQRTRYGAYKPTVRKFLGRVETVIF